MQKIIITGIGADVELFLKNKFTNEIVSAENYIKGTKYEPFIFDKSDKYFTTSLDNVLAEFTIPPANTINDFCNYLERGVNYINNSIPKNLCTEIFPSANLDWMYLQTEQAKLFGCEPDVNAYTKWVNVKPNAEDKTLRSAGGHIHIGYNEKYIVPDLTNPSEKILNKDIVRQTIVKVLDLYLSVPMVILEPDNKRKELYGKAGAYRPKTYGLEYRTLSNYYLSSKQLTKLVYNNVIDAINFINQGGTLDKELENFIQQTINTCNKQDAKYLLNEFKIAA